MPSYGGVAIFGRGVKITTGDLEFTVQKNNFPALNGTESLAMGAHGLMTTAEGVLFGAGAGGLQSAEAAFRSYRDGIARTLVDSFGGSWSNVLLDTFTPQGRIIQDPFGNYWRPYVARFFHLSST